MRGIEYIPIIGLLLAYGAREKALHEYRGRLQGKNKPSFDERVALSQVEIQFDRALKSTNVLMFGVLVVLIFLGLVSP